MRQCIRDLQEAIKNVDDDYFHVMGYNQHSVKYQQAAEHAFTAEVYFQLKTIINQNPNHYTNLKLHFDLEKGRFGGKSPDIVIHVSPTSRDTQKLYVEIKTNPKITNYDRDLKKIFDAATNNNGHEYLGFENVVFVVGKRNFEQVVATIIEYIKTNGISNNDKRLSKIYLLHFYSKQNITMELFSTLTK